MAAPGTYLLLCGLVLCHVTGSLQVTVGSRDDPGDNAPSSSESIDESANRGSGGATYTRWGRNVCSENGTELVYAGVVAGQYYTQTGGGANHLCLPMDPVWGNYNDAAKNEGRLYGTEFEVGTTSNIFPFDGVSTYGQTVLKNNNVPCAVCRSRRASSAIMLPARKICYDGWNLEYYGYLMSAHNAHKGRTEFLCVDAHPEVDPAGYRDEGGNLLYTVEGVCGSLPCPPYVNGREMSCAVCTK